MPDSPSTPQATGHKIPPEVQKSVIEQIAKEIQQGADIITSLRTRSAFTIWIGPYIVLGSILVAVKGGFTVNWQDPWFCIGLAVAAVCYVALGHSAGRIERHTLTRSNSLRECIDKIAKTGEIDMDLYRDKVLPEMIVKSYRNVFIVLLFCFFGVAIVASKIESTSAESERAVDANTPARTSVTPAPLDPNSAPTATRP